MGIHSLSQKTITLTIAYIASYVIIQFLTWLNEIQYSVTYTRTRIDLYFKIIVHHLYMYHTILCKLHVALFTSEITSDAIKKYLAVPSV